MAGVVRRSRFYFDEDDGTAIDRDKINFADIVAVTPGNDCIAEPLQVASRGVLAAAAQRPSRKNSLR